MSTKKKSLRQLVVFVLSFFTFMVNANAQSQQDNQQRALDMIKNFAGDICNNPSLEGIQEGKKLSGNAKAKLDGLMRNISDIGIEGAGEYQKESWSGVIQSDLKDILIKNADCKLEVYKSLKDKILPTRKEAA